MAQRTCSVRDCDEPTEARGFCVKHYSRWRRRGDPLKVGRETQSTTYGAVHQRINRVFPRTGRCEYCGQRQRRTHYASIEHRYSSWRHDWLELCTRCHQWFDEMVYGTGQRKKTHCPQGHPYDEENTLISRGQRRCRACLRAEKRRRRAEGKSA